MSTAELFQPITIRDYLDGEQASRHKHEYVEGYVYAMVGASNAHNRIATNATVLLGSQLRGRPCQVFNSDTKVRIRHSRGTRFYYPDVSVACVTNPLRDSFQDAPVVIIEVLSRATRRTDEYEKREAYLSIDSLCVYVLLEQSSANTVVYRRGENGFQREIYSGLDAIVDLSEIQCRLALSGVYANVEFEAERSEEDDE